MKIEVPPKILETVPPNLRDTFLAYVDNLNQQAYLLEEIKNLHEQKIKIYNEPIILKDTIEFQWKAPYKEKKLLYQKYVEERLSAKEIAERYSCAKSTILKYLKKFDIPIRDTGKPINKRRGLAYGQKIEKRRQIAHKREQQNIQKMQELREQGYSFHKIAEILNTMKVPTKTRKGKWHGRVICDILKRNNHDD